MPVVCTHACAGMNTCYVGYMHMCSQTVLVSPCIHLLPALGIFSPNPQRPKNGTTLFSQCPSSNWPNSINTRVRRFSGRDFLIKKNKHDSLINQMKLRSSQPQDYTRTVACFSINHTPLIWDRLGEAVLCKCSRNWSLLSQ